MKTVEKKSAREASYLALLTYAKKQKYLSESLEEWRKNASPSSIDFSLAQEITYGTERRKATLNYFAEKLAEQGKLHVKLKERLLLFIALYQYFFMDKIPIYALTNETVSLAYKYCRPPFVRFLNAILRKLPKTKIQLPKGNNLKDLSIRYSYPEFLIKLFLEDYGMEKACEIMETENAPSCTMFRVRENEEKNPSLRLITEKPFPVALLEEQKNIESVIKSSKYYIQNITPATLIGELCTNAPPPKRILDLCAAPGGKVIAIHDFFPNALLHANDITKKKIERLKQNLKKYEIQANLHLSLGEEYHSKEKFDIIIADLPCSNSGVLNKRPEARWRITKDFLKELEKMQFAIIENALKYLKENGQIWYMTCSILKKENENMIEKFCQKYRMEKTFIRKILPEKKKWDGGFACSLKKIKEEA